MILDFERRPAMKEWFDEYRKYIAEGEISKAKELLLEKIPADKIVYKYFRGINRDWNSITNQKMWLCQAGKFNDPFDCAFLYNCRSKEIYDRATEYDLAVEEGVKQYEQDKESERIQESVFIACFSEKCDSMLMWSHYGDEHRGLCAGYNLHELIEKYSCFPVIYSDKMPQKKELDIENKDMLYESILTKSKDWKYEAEWRIIDIDGNSRGENGKPLKFVKPVSIYLGKRQNDTVKKNHEKFNIIKEQKPDSNASEVFESDEFQVDINAIINYKHEEKIELYDFDLSRDSFQLERKIYNI